MGNVEAGHLSDKTGYCYGHGSIALDTKIKSKRAVLRACALALKSPTSGKGE